MQNTGNIYFLSGDYLDEDKSFKLSFKDSVEFIFGNDSVPQQVNIAEDIFISKLKARIEERLTTLILKDELSSKLEHKVKETLKLYNIEAMDIKSEESVLSKFTPKYKIDDRVRIDVVGDVHGLYDELIELMGLLGYDKEGNHPQRRKLLFLGDIVDRGTKSLEVLKLVIKLSKTGHYCVMGNHERKTLKNILSYKNGDRPRGGISQLELISFLSKRPKEMTKVEKFIKSMPHYYVQGDYVFVHANISSFNPHYTTFSECIYGTDKSQTQEGLDNDDVTYDRLHSDGINKYKLIRGHVNSKNTYSSIYSLDRGQAFGGYLAALSLDRVEDDDYHSATTLFKVDFDFEKYLQDNPNLNYSLSRIPKDVVKRTSYGLFNVYKYTSEVSEKDLWSSKDINQDLLRQSRGLVTDFAGNIIVHPFDRTFNYFEGETLSSISDNTEVLCVNKENGFLGNISLDPYKKKLLFSTTGGIEGEMTEYISDKIDSNLYKRLVGFLSRNPMTLSFEVIDRRDPHIIEPKRYGLVLIGARGLSLNDKSMTEEEVDDIANKINHPNCGQEIYRPSYFRCSFKEAKNKVKVLREEGFMIRLDNESQDYVMKLKSPFYLLTKYYARHTLLGNKFLELDWIKSSYRKVIQLFETELEIVHTQYVDELNQTDTEPSDLTDKVESMDTGFDHFRKMHKFERINFIRGIVDSGLRTFS